MCAGAAQHAIQMDEYVAGKVAQRNNNGDTRSAVVVFAKFRGEASGVAVAPAWSALHGPIELLGGKLLGV